MTSAAASARGSEVLDARLYLKPRKDDGCSTNSSQPRRRPRQHVARPGEARLGFPAEEAVERPHAFLARRCWRAVLSLKDQHRCRLLPRCDAGRIRTAAPVQYKGTMSSSFLAFPIVGVTLLLR